MRLALARAFHVYTGMTFRAAIGALAAYGVACIDFGDAPSPDASILADAGHGDAGPPDTGAPCVEGMEDPALAENTITLVEMNVDPMALTIAPNTVVAFKNTGGRNHRLVSGEPGAPIAPENGGFNTGALAPGDSYGHRFCTVRTLLF